MGTLRDWWERCEQRRRSGAAPTSQKDGETAAVLSPLHPLNPISPLNPANLSWSDGKPVQPDATALPYGPHNDPAARHDAMVPTSFMIASVFVLVPLWSGSATVPVADKTVHSTQSSGHATRPHFKPARHNNRPPHQYYQSARQYCQWHEH